MPERRDFYFVDKKTYFDELRAYAQHAGAGDRMLVEAMNFEPSEPAVRELAEAMSQAAARGARVTLSVDAHDFLLIGHLRLGPLWFHGELPKRLDKISRGRLALGQKIQAAGGTFAITNQPHRAHTSPFSGRSHIKIAILNDIVYVGGCNLDMVKRVDIMARWQDAGAADWAYELLQREAETESSAKAFSGKDQRFEVDGSTTLFIDAGVRDQSIIFEHALQLIDGAKSHLFLACQFYPHGITANRLAAAAKRGVDVQLLFNRPRKHAAAAPAHQAVIWQERLRGTFLRGALPAGTPFLHAKVLASENAAMIGSHNFVADGVRFGTAEIALLSRDAAFGKSAVQNILTQTPVQDDRRFSFWSE